VDLPPEGTEVSEVSIDEIPDQELLAMLTPEFSSVVPILYRSGHFRSTRLRRYLNTTVLSGLNRLLERLELAAEAYEKDDRLKPATVLVRRARADFEAAIVCTFSGLSFVCRDQVRDVMEIEYLLRDFRYDLARLDKWAKASPDEERDRFNPGILRQREAKRRGIGVNKLVDSLDYKVHSRALHVTKASVRSGARGVEADRGKAGVFRGDQDIWEIFIHAGRLLEQVIGLYEAAGLSAPAAPDDDPFDVARRACEKAQTRYLKTVFEAARARKAAASDKSEPVSFQEWLSRGPRV
jgi:hypothetical protein